MRFRTAFVSGWTLFKDLIFIPEHIDKGRLVLRLTEGVTDPQETVGNSLVYFQGDWGCLREE